MGPKTRALAGTLDELASLLRRHGELHWASWLERDAGLLRGGDFSGITDLLSAYGGMGSFNDLLLCSQHGHRMDGRDADRVNASLAELRSRAWNLVKEISREAAFE